MGDKGVCEAMKSMLQVNAEIFWIIVAICDVEIILTCVFCWTIVDIYDFLV